MRILIAGGSGLLGAPATRALLGRGHEVTVLSRGGHAVPSGARTLRADRADAGALRESLTGESFDLVVDLLAYDAADVERLLGMPGLRIGHYVFASTGQVYLVSAERRAPFREADAALPPMPEPAVGTRDHGQWVYGVGKRAAELAACEQGAARGMPTTALRLPVVQGAGDPSKRLWAYLQRLLDGGPLLLPDGGTQPVRFVWTEDVARALVTIAGSPPPPEPAYNLAQPDEPSLCEFVTAAAAILGVTPRLVSCTWEQAREAGLDHQFSTYSGPWCSRPDPALALRDLGFRGSPTSAWLPEVVRAHLAEGDPEPHPGYARRALELALAERIGGASRGA